MQTVHRGGAPTVRAQYWVLTWLSGCRLAIGDALSRDERDTKVPVNHFNVTLENAGKP